MLAGPMRVGLLKSQDSGCKSEFREAGGGGAGAVEPTQRGRTQLR